MSDLELDGVIVAAVRKSLCDYLGWQEKLAEPYIRPMTDAVLKAVTDAGYVISKEAKNGAI